MCSDILNIVKIAFEKGAEYTKEIVARMGRAAGTVGERSLGQVHMHLGSSLRRLRVV